MIAKQELRALARARRANLAVSGFAERIAGHAEALGLDAGTVVGGYAALAGEADPRLLLARLRLLGCAIAFPRVAGRDATLVFHHVPAGAALAEGAYRVPEPLAHWPAVVPQAVLIPLLAFDAEGYRLGYGGGFYDRTLARLHPLRAIGIAYAGQETARLPREAHDMPLDAILTEAGLRAFTAHKG